MGGRHLRTHHCTQHIHTQHNQQQHCDVTIETSNNIIQYCSLLSEITLSNYKLTLCVQPVTYIHENTYT